MGSRRLYGRLRLRGLVIEQLVYNSSNSWYKISITQPIIINSLNPSR